MNEWFQHYFGWMYWTVPSALVFAILFAAIAGMVVWDRIAPGYSRKGLLPVSTTRGDRFFIAVMTLVGVFLLWLGIVGATMLWGPVGIAVVLFGVILRWG